MKIKMNSTKATCLAVMLSAIGCASTNSLSREQGKPNQTAEIIQDKEIGDSCKVNYTGPLSLPPSEWEVYSACLADAFRYGERTRINTQQAIEILEGLMDHVERQRRYQFRRRKR